MQEKLRNIIIHWIYLLNCTLTILFLDMPVSAQQNKVFISNETNRHFYIYSVKDTVQINTLYERGRTMVNTDLDSSLTLFHMALNLSQQNNYFPGIARNMVALGYCHEAKGNYELALQYDRKAFVYCAIVKNPLLYFKLYNNMATYYKNRGISDTAVYYYHLVLEQLRRHPEIDSTGELEFFTYLGLGGLYIWFDQNEFNTAFYYFRKAEQLVQHNRAARNQASIYISLGAAYANVAAKAQRPLHEKALFYMKKAISLLEGKGRSSSLNLAYINIGIMYINAGEIQRGISYLKKSEQENVSNKEPGNQIRFYLALGAAYSKQKNYEDAETYLKKAEAVGDSIRSRSDLLEVYSAFSNLYFVKKDYKMAFVAEKYYSGLKDSLLNEEKIIATKQLEVKYRTAEKDNKIIANTLQLDRQKSKIREQQVWIFAGIGIALSLSGLLLLLYRNNRHRRHLQEEKLRNIEQGHEISVLRAMMQGEEKERGRLASELHDGIVSQLAAAKLNFSEVQRRYTLLNNAPDFEEALNQLDDAALDLRKTAHNLMPEVLLQQGIIAALSIYCKRMSKSSGLCIYFHLTGNLPEMETEVSLSLYRIVQELIQNIIKHAKATEAIVQMDVDDDQLLLTVEDNGTGIKETLEKDTLLSTVRTRVNVLAGQIDISSRTGKGTSITIELARKQFLKKTEMTAAANIAPLYPPDQG